MVNEPSPSPEKKLPFADLRLTRRNFLRGAGLSAAGAVASRELINGLNGSVSNDDGSLIGLYETHPEHDQILTPEKLDPRATALFIEAIYPQGPFKMDDLPRSEINIVFGASYGLDTRNQKPKFTFSDELLAECAQRGIPICVGDVGQEEKLTSLQDSDDLIPFLTRAVFFASGSAYLSMDKMARFFDGELPRREFMLRLARLAMLGGAAKWINGIMRFTDQQIERLQIQPLNRVISRLEAMIGHFVPEDSDAFLRNLVMADKLLILAQHQKAQNITPNIVFNAHWGHSGVEDFYQLGLPFCHQLIKMYPRHIVQKFIDYSGGVEDFCSVRAIHLTPDFQSTTSGNQRDITSGNLSSERIIDEELKALLS